MRDRDSRYDAAFGRLGSAILVMISAAIISGAMAIYGQIISRREVIGEPSSYNCKAADCAAEQLQVSIQSANAAADTVDLALWQLAFNVAGLAGLAFTIYYARKAWQTAEETLRETRNSSERQLRAYVSITPVDLYRVGVDEFPQVRCSVRNHGVTPAFDVNYQFSMAILPLAVAEAATRGEADRALDAGVTLFPGDDSAWFSLDKSLTADQLDRIQNCSETICMWGQAKYSDAFGKEQTTEFNFQLDCHSYAKHVAAIAMNTVNLPNYYWKYGKRHNRAS